MKKFLFIAIFILCQSAIAEVIPNSLFQNNMVLQRRQPIAVFGKATSEKFVEISFKDKTYTTKVKDGYWIIFLDKSQAGGPYTLTIKGENEVVLSNILVGEVWLCSGQSNMEMPVQGNKGQPINGSNLAILNSENSQIRLFKVGKKMASEPLNSCEGEWTLAKPETVKGFSATAYFFGKMLQETLNIPIGLINSSWGGTPAEAWTPKEIIDSEFKDFKGWNTDDSKPQKNPSVLYNGMIHPLKPYTIKGVIWYQGEANKNYYQNYTYLFSSMIKSWRTNWNQGDFPFYFVQIAPLGWGGDNQAFLREAQLKTMHAVPNTGMAVTLDIGEKGNIHPAEKQKVGERLALWALAKDYGYKNIQYSGPVYKSMSVAENKVAIEFDYAPNGLATFGKELHGFKVAGADKFFYEADAILLKGKLIVWSDKVEHPIAVRYGWQDWVDGSLFNTAGLPASSFRTDNWDN
ncbi:sialate O-acetylesterase [Tamlana sp. 2_MG-2023]|uniref:sialate O-acetylesterase n=1 Tax=unclassified Tamlana TaxID=2614803 RepID=UPI0026E43EA7|nr:MULTISPECIES: sialate O-acetylesterase [unclassified Tamlana]MDO6760963.1 sialate O-acetylesterase [Tamlana sp. 2_MG-2023]MDO6791219.1 sialate O-acetylesterase [Tamlana sp. 1_MG-2023]